MNDQIAYFRRFPGQAAALVGALGYKPMAAMSETDRIEIEAAERVLTEIGAAGR